jgi:hypothetical protein
MNNEFINHIMRFISTLTLGGVVWLTSSMITVREDVVAIKAHNDYAEVFMSKPRFTHEDYRQEIAPLLQRINRLELEVEKLRSE